MFKNYTDRTLFFTVFITGAAVLIIEITAVRILSPIYGSSLYVLSSVLTVILAALSIGYWYGGKRSDQKQSTETLYSIIALSGLCVLGLLLFAQLLLPTFGPSFSPQVGPLLFSFGLFFIPAFLLGTISPYVIKLQSLTTPIEHIGSVVGATLFWGTSGSIFGSITTGFWLIPEIGVTRTIVLVSTLLIALGILMPLITGHPLQRKKVVIFLSSALILGILLQIFDAKHRNEYVYMDDGIYSSIKIKDITLNQRPVRILTRDTNNSSAIYLNSKELVFPYAKFVHTYSKLISDPQNALILGGGAYTIPRALTHHDPNLLIDVVEIEPVLFTLSQQYFDLSDVSRITNYQMDGRVFLRQQKTKKYDFVFGDIFSTDQAAPFHLTTYEFYKLVKSNLSPDGIFFLNVVGTPNNSSPSLVGSIAKTLSVVFPTVKAYGLDSDPSTLQNIVFVARNGETPININAWDTRKISDTVTELDFDDVRLGHEILLTDDHAPIDYLMVKQKIIKSLTKH